MQKLLTRFIPAADEVFRLQNGKEADCELFRGFCEEGHYGGRTRPSKTRQGIYAVTAKGKFLASVNTRSADRVVRMLESALQRFAELAPEHSKLSDERVQALAGARRIEHRFPKGGTALRVVTRDLPGAKTHERWHAAAWNIDWAWFKPAEMRGFFPRNAESGARHVVPRALVARLARCHFVDNARGQTKAYSKKDLKVAELSAIVEAVDDERVRVRLEGKTRAVRAGGQGPGMLLTLRGEATWSRRDDRLAKFELLALGDRWGRTRFNARGRTAGTEPIGFFVELLPPARTRIVAPAHYWDYRW